MDIGGLAERIKEVPDPRRAWGTIRHKREAIVVIGLGTFLCGGEDGEAMEQFGLLREQEVRQLLEIRRGIPDERPVFRVFTRVQRWRGVCAHGFWRCREGRGMPSAETGRRYGAAKAGRGLRCMG